MSDIDLTRMIGNLSQSLPNIQHLLGGFSYLLGIGLYMASLKHIREHFTKDDAKSGMGHAFSYFVAGTALLFMPTMFGALSNTLFGSSSNPLQYTTTDPYNIYYSMTVVIETMGIVWFMRGAVLIVHANDPKGAQEGSKDQGLKALLFVLAGIFAINFHLTIGMVDYLINEIIAFASSR